ncbi:hypothetical protein N657DRAFT_638265 [Parathielavia appendiculata]|uniref:Secreted protein n=1 Tax=Parathielavia appendiculata TaxID=2587402 RepID=A0AAN6TQ52_9PEZI|nr:hypothetical protein N657DRAFT_638265 [Parathielavia appendiculata]
MTWARSAWRVVKRIICLRVIYLAPAAVYSSKRKQGVVDLDPGPQPKKPEPSTALQTPTRVEDCIWVACTSKNAGATANSEARNTALGLTRLEQIGDGSYEPGTAAPRASARFIDGLDALDPDFEDAHDAALAAADAAACEAREDAAALQ